MGKLDIALVNEAEQTVYAEADMAMERWAEYLDAVKQGFSKAGKGDISESVLRTTAMCLENTHRVIRRMDEATQTVNVGSFINHGFELLSAVMPSMIAHDVVSVQPMTRRTGEVFFMDFKYGTNRGDIVNGDTMFGQRAVGNGNTYYSSETDIDETIESGDGATTDFTATLTSAPLVAGTISVKTKDAAGNLLTLQDDGAGAFVGDVGGGANTVNYATGAVAVSFSAAPAGGQDIVLTYDLDFQQNPELIPEVEVDITSEPVRATTRKLRAKYTLDAAWDMEQAYGKGMDQELKTALASDIRHELDGQVLDKLRAQGTAPTYPFSRTPSDGISWKDHKEEFFDKSIVPAKNGIFDLTRRAQGNFIVAGTNVMNVIETLPNFVPSGNMQTGPYFAGTLGGMRVYNNPFYPTDEYVVGYKGQLFIEAGFVWAPYLPLFTTRTVVLDDIQGRFGLISASGQKMINTNFYAPGKITA